MDSAVERYLVLPFILHKLGYDNERIHNIIFETNNKSPLYKLRMGILRSKKIKDLYKQYGNNIENSLQAIMTNLSKNFFKQVKNKNGQIVNELNAEYVMAFIDSFVKGTWDIPKTLFDADVSP